MGVSSEIRDAVKEIIKSAWKVREGKKIPDVDDLTLKNEAITFEAVVLYADMADSTGLVSRYPPDFAAEVYKSYLISCCRIIAANSGEITAFDGDRVMAVFFEGGKNTNAMKTALNINWAARMVNEELKAYYQSKEYTLRQAIGVDGGKVFVAKTGVRGSNDLVWIGGAANYAAKLCALREDYFSAWVTDTVYGSALDEAKKSSGGTDMWSRKHWDKYNRTVYAAGWTLEP